MGAVKRAADDNGLILRLHKDTHSGVHFDLHLDGSPLAAAHLCDARETNLEPFPVKDGVARVQLDGGIAKVRLHRRFWV